MIDAFGFHILLIYGWSVLPFISIEGIDGSGKTEQVKLLVGRLRASGQEVLQTKEPDGGHLGADVRSLLTQEGRVLSEAEQMLLVSASRYDHVRNVIAPALAKGHWVVSDRFVDSTYAFQVATSDEDLCPAFRAITSVVVGAHMPDLTVILDLPVEYAEARRAGRGGAVADPAEARRNFDVIRNALQSLAQSSPGRCKLVDARQPLEVVGDEIWGMVAPLL